ncbi:hypothetical protein LUZ60_017630 [Juncus effusus]|nr:hypothetical protein LUZ60_017630 [Juncus effusus]
MATRLFQLRRYHLTHSPTLLTRSSSSSSSSQPTISVKQITGSNFPPSLLSLRNLIEQSDFISVDAEMTGVSSAPWRDSFVFDSPDVRFLKLKDSASRFAVIQFGVCPFKWDPQKSSFVAHPHNFYIFPRKELPIDGLSYEFLCQTSSMDFLTKHQFDFNTCIHEGISYLSRAQEKEALEKLGIITNSPSSNSDLKIQSIGDLLFTERMKSRFNEWLEEILRDNLGQTEVINKFGDFKTGLFKMKPALLLDGFTSHQLRLIQTVIRKDFKDIVFVRIPSHNNTCEYRAVYVHSEEEKSSLLKEVQTDLRDNTESMVRSAVGFRHVIDLLSSQNKLIVGHNCILDIAHVYSKFIGPIPSTMAQFIKEVHELFPYLIDTKNIMNASQAVQFLMKNKSKSLSSAFSSLCPTIACGPHSSKSDLYVNIEIDIDDDGSFNSGAKHEAGYDAFMTGCVFAQLCSHLGLKPSQNLSISSISDPLHSNPKLKPFLNQICPTWNSGTVLDLTTGTEKPESGTYNRKFPKVVFENVVLLWGFPSNVNTKNLKDSIAKVFGPNSVVSVFYIDSSAALVQFKKEEFVKDFLVLKESLERESDETISMLHPLSVVFEGGNTKAGDYNTYRDVIACSLSKVLFKDQADASGVSCRSFELMEEERESREIIS